MSNPNSTQRLRLYLIRHGEVEQALDLKLIGRTDSPLSVRGLDQSHELAETLANEELSVVYSSDLKRARTTAEIIAERSGLKVKENSVWREIDMGQWEGLTMKSIHDETPELVAQLFNDPASFRYPGGESFAAFSGRIQNALKDLLSTHEKGQVALVTHGGVCRVIIGTSLGMPPGNWLRLAQGYGCLNVIDWYDGNPMLQLLNRRPLVIA
jgi:alpha-ribazole phosphatase/probable phosphoglycerate mutase